MLLAMQSRVGLDIGHGKYRQNQSQKNPKRERGIGQKKHSKALLEGNMKASQIPLPQSFGASHRPQQPQYVLIDM